MTDNDPIDEQGKWFAEMTRRRATVEAQQEGPVQGLCILLSWAGPPCFNTHIPVSPSEIPQTQNDEAKEQADAEYRHPGDEVSSPQIGP